MPPAAIPRISLDARLSTKPSPIAWMTNRLNTSLYIARLALVRRGAGSGFRERPARSSLELLHDLLAETHDISHAEDEQWTRAGVLLDRGIHFRGRRAFQIAEVPIGWSTTPVRPHERARLPASHEASVHGQASGEHL